jgi:cytochrome c-type biogenesis protein
MEEIHIAGVNQILMNTQVTIGIAFLAGLASFLSPCILPLVPIYLAQLVGPSVYQAISTDRTGLTRLITFLHAATFVIGFALAFTALGAVASTLGYFLSINKGILRQGGGIILMLMGLHVAGIVPIPFLSRQKRFAFQPEQPGYPASFLFGIIFGIAWTPCISPILSAILSLAAASATLQQGVWLLLAYSLGLGVPFLLLGLGFNQFSRALKGLKPHLGKIEVGTGVFMIGVGVVIYFNLLLYLNQFLNFGTSL